MKTIVRYHYGDGTLNESGNIRYTLEEIKEIMKADLYELKNYLYYNMDIIQAVLERALFKYSNGNNHEVQYIFYGSINDGFYASRSEIIKYLLFKAKLKDLLSIHFSELVYQPYCRNYKRHPKAQNKRGYMQLKWLMIERCLKKACLQSFK